MELLKARPTLCFRCWGKGHIKAQCKSVVDRNRTCYRCGVVGHTAVGCLAPVSCALCREGGRDHGHRVGSSMCVSMLGTGSGLASSQVQSQVPMEVDNAARRAVDMTCDDV